MELKIVEEVVLQVVRTKKPADDPRRNLIGKKTEDFHLKKMGATTAWSADRFDEYQSLTLREIWGNAVAACTN